MTLLTKIKDTKYLYDKYFNALHVISHATKIILREIKQAKYFTGESFPIHGTFCFCNQTFGMTATTL